MTTIEQILEYDAADIEEAAEQTDTTIVELLADIQQTRENKDIPIMQHSVHTHVWVESQAECMLDWLEENRPKSKIEDATAEAEYRADQAQDEKWLQEVTK